MRKVLIRFEMCMNNTEGAFFKQSLSNSNTGSVLEFLKCLVASSTIAGVTFSTSSIWDSLTLISMDSLSSRSSSLSPAEL